MNTTLLDEPTTRPSSTPAQRLRSTTAAVRLSFTWFGVRKTLTPEQKAQAAAKDYLSKVADSLKKDGAATQAVVIQGRPADTILEFADKNRVDLIIMSTHGRSGPSRWVFGSVADKIVRHSTAPVLITSPPGVRNG